MFTPEDFFVNLAASLAFELLRAGAARVQRAVLGPPQEQALKRAYQAAFEAALRAGELDEANAARVADLWRQFLALPDVANTLLDAALAGASVPDLEALQQRFESLDYDRSALAIDFDRMLAAFYDRLANALLDEASTDGSPLFNQVNLGRILVIHSLLRNQQHTLRAISEMVQRLRRRAAWCISTTS